MDSIGEQAANLRRAAGPTIGGADQYRMQTRQIEVEWSSPAVTQPIQSRSDRHPAQSHG